MMPGISGNTSDVGRPVTIVEKAEKGFKLNEDALREVLTKDCIKDKPVVVVSIAGAFRLGKSFMLDFFLRFMNAKMLLNWIGAEDTPLEGFSWRGGTKPETTGLVVWSELFEAEGPDGHPVAVLLMDTQGLFDNRSTASDCVNIFALSTLISSVQIFNLSGNIQEDDLQHLQYFTEYGRMALEQSGETPFQRLLFLVRNYSLTDEHGHEGGRRLLEEMLEVRDDQVGELQMLREHIRNSFSDVDCFLMPHPGKNVSKAGFDGSTRDLDGDFKEQLQVLVPHGLSKENLVVKKIGGTVIRARELIGFISSYFNALNSDALPEPRTLLKATAEATNTVAVEKAKAHYDEQLCDMFGERDVFVYVAEETLKHKHDTAVDSSVDVFKKSRKILTSSDPQRFQSALCDKKELERMYDHYLLINKGFHETAQKQNEGVLQAAFARYVEIMAADCGDKSRKVFDAEELSREHNVAKTWSMNLFREANKLGDDMFIERYQEELILKLDLKFQMYVGNNDERRRQAERDNDAAMTAAKEHYCMRLRQITDLHPNEFIDEADLMRVNRTASDASMNIFRNMEMGGERFSRPYEDQLRQELDNIFRTCLADNARRLSFIPSGRHSIAVGVSGAVWAVGWTLLKLAAGVATIATAGTGMVIVGATSVVILVCITVKTMYSRFMLRRRRI